MISMMDDETEDEYEARQTEELAEWMEWLKTGKYQFPQPGEM